MCSKPANYLEGGPLMWMLPLYLHVNQKSIDEDDDDLFDYPLMHSKYFWMSGKHCTS